METFRFVLNDDTIQDIDGIVFGCSNDNMNFEFEGTSISGIMGQIWSPDSFVMQLADFIQNRFFYCVVPYDKGWAQPSLLTFGSAIPTTLCNVQTTRFVVPSTNN